MKILTFDTSLNKTYITLCEDDKVLTKKTIESTDEQYHSAKLIPAIVEILKDNNITMQDIKVLGTNIGPGSFTGIRVCNTIARVFAQQLDAKLAGIPSLQILSKINNTDKKSMVLLDARKNKVYKGVYSSIGEIIEAPVSVEKSTVDNIDAKEYFIITDSSICNYLSEKGIDSTNYEASDYELGEYLAYFTNKALKDGEDLNWAKVKPLYIQPPSITKPKVK